MIACKEIHVASTQFNSQLYFGTVNETTGCIENQNQFNFDPMMSYYYNDTLYVQTNCLDSNPFLVKIDLKTNITKSVKMSVRLKGFVVSKGIIYGSKKKKLKIIEKIKFFFFFFF